jgi:isocitrate lyase
VKKKHHTKKSRKEQITKKIRIKGKKNRPKRIREHVQKPEIKRGRKRIKHKTEHGTTIFEKTEAVKNILMMSRMAAANTNKRRIRGRK